MVTLPVYADFDALFQSTHPVRGATEAANVLFLVRDISIHAPRAGCDLTAWFSLTIIKDFNPRTPCGVRPVGFVSLFRGLLFQSTHPVRGATYSEFGFNPLSQISIHAPRAGCDLLIRSCTFTISSDFNPRTPCGVRRTDSQHGGGNKIFQSTHPVRGATLIRSCTFTISSVFQSTHPVRGATASTKSQHTALAHFNPRTPCGVRRHFFHAELLRSLISIHAPRAGCDSSAWLIALLSAIRFQSTHPVRGATASTKSQHTALAHFNPRTPCGVRRHFFHAELLRSLISIHAPRAGCDSSAWLIALLSAIRFQSTHPVRGATGAYPHPCHGRRISIHAPRAGCDCTKSDSCALPTYFNPRTPCGVRRQFLTKSKHRHTFQSTHPVRGAT